MTKIAILFHDNDFYNTFVGVLKTLGESIKYMDGKENFDKEKLTLIINDIAYSCYLLFQNDWESNEQLKKDETHLREYLTIKEKDVLMNEEVDEYKKGTEWDNHETFILEYDSYRKISTTYSM